MNVIGKIIAIIAFVLMILLIVNYKSFLPYFNSMAFGGGTLSPTQIGASYIEQANRLSPYNGMIDQGGSQTWAVTYGSYVAAQQQAAVTSGRQTVSRGTITVEKIDTLLALSTENVSVSSPSQKIHIWLTNKPTITDTTKFIDFGVLKNGGIQSYTVNLASNISLTEYKHVMIINTETYEIYGQSVLSR